MTSTPSTPECFLPLEDFATLFSYLWHQDFPVDPHYRSNTSGRADWTIHIGIVVRRCADLAGMFCSFEDGNRTDAQLRDNRPDAEPRIALEWEWNEPGSKGFNELGKLQNKPGLDYAVLITYANTDNLQTLLDTCASNWKAPYPLLLILIEFKHHPGALRELLNLLFFPITADSQPLADKPLRKTTALPWRVQGTRWETKKHSQPDSPTSENADDNGTQLCGD